VAEALVALHACVRQGRVFVAPEGEHGLVQVPSQSLGKS
jgi:hypothetical protein